MTKTKKWGLALVALVMCVVFFAGCGSGDDDDVLPLDNLIGVWEGSYGANQGETGLTLTIFNEGNNFRALFEFYNLPGRNNSLEGSYYMTVSSDQSSYILRGHEWIERPINYVFVDLKGTI